MAALLVQITNSQSVGDIFMTMRLKPVFCSHGFRPVREKERVQPVRPEYKGAGGGEEEGLPRQYDANCTNNVVRGTVYRRQAS